MSEELTCITCPIGCRLAIDRLSGGELAVTGNRCPRGAVYAREELLAPKRTVSATVRVQGAAQSVGGQPSVRRIPCKTSAPFPKEKVGELLEAIYAKDVPLPVSRGDILINDALGSGIDVVVTRTLGRGE